MTFSTVEPNNVHLQVEGFHPEIVDRCVEKKGLFPSRGCVDPFCAYRSSTLTYSFA